MQKTECNIDLVQGRCRRRFTPADYDFVSMILGRSHDTDSLATLFNDPEALDIILDEPLLADIITEASSEFTISSRFYLYILTRQTLAKQGLNNRILADYVAEVLSTYFHSLEMQKPSVRVHPLGYIFDVTKQMQKEAPEDVFRLRLHIADFVLFQLGIYPERFCTRKMAKSPLDFEFLEGMAVMHILKALEDHRAESLGLVEPLEELTVHFRKVRLALNLMCENNLFIREQSLAYGRGR